MINYLKTHISTKFFVLIFIVLYFITFYALITKCKLNLMSFVGVPVISNYTFADLRVVTTASDCIRKGFDPLYENPCYIMGSLQLNYPRIWQGLSMFGLTESQTVPIGFASAFLFYTCFVFIFLPKKINIKENVLYLSCLFSPAVLLLVERGNVDIIIFILVAIAIPFVNRNEFMKRAIGYSILLFASVLKLFPLFGFVIYIREFKKDKKRALIFGSILLFLFVAYIVFTINDIRAIASITPKGTSWSYGFQVFFMTNDRVIHSLLSLTHVNDTLLAIILKYLPYVALISAISITLVLSFLYRKSDKFAYVERIQTHIISFQIGASIFIGTFMLGNNWDYRLVFLLFCIPQLVEWSRASKKILSLPNMTLAFILLTLWSSFWINYSTFAHNLLEELTNWMILANLILLVSLSLRKDCCRYLNQLYTHLRSR